VGAVSAHGSGAFRPAQVLLGKSAGDSNMAVQQNKKSPSKRGMHRSHNALNQPGTAVEPTTGEVHLRHHISPNGFYRGRKVLATKSDA
jgi:large subunit ribosomal protein L32